MSCKVQKTYWQCSIITLINCNFQKQNQEKHFLRGPQHLIFSIVPKLPPVSQIFLKIKNKNKKFLKTSISSLITAMADVQPYKGSELHVLTGERDSTAFKDKGLHQKQPARA